MFHIALYEPEIPPNTGNIMRQCVNTGAKLELIHPLGFSMDEKRLRRAGMDYRDLATVSEHKNYAAFCMAFPQQRCFAFSTKGTHYYHEVEYQRGDIFLFGPETRGLPKHIRSTLPPEHVLKIPMQANSRSLNLANSTAVVLYEAWRQCGFTMQDIDKIDE